MLLILSCQPAFPFSGESLSLRIIAGSRQPFDLNGRKNSLGRYRKRRLQRLPYRCRHLLAATSFSFNANNDKLQGLSLSRSSVIVVDDVVTDNPKSK